MKPITSPDHPLIGELISLFELFNDTLFNNALKTPAHVVKPDRKVVFRFMPSTHNPQMVVGSGFASKDFNLLEEYLHQMIHMANWWDKEVDITSNHYHNKHFLEMALRTGMYVVRHETKGWYTAKISKPTGTYKSPEEENQARLMKALHRAERILDHKALRKGRQDLQNYLQEHPKEKFLLKYVCQCDPPHNSIRSGRRPDGEHAPHIRCEKCGSKFLIAD